MICPFSWDFFTTFTSDPILIWFINISSHFSWLLFGISFYFSVWDFIPVFFWTFKSKNVYEQFFQIFAFFNLGLRKNQALSRKIIYTNLFYLPFLYHSSFLVFLNYSNLPVVKYFIEIHLIFSILAPANLFVVNNVIDHMSPTVDSNLILLQLDSFSLLLIICHLHDTTFCFRLPIYIQKILPPISVLAYTH